MKCLPKVQSLLVTLVTISPPPSLPFWHLLLPSFILAMTFPAPCLPVHVPGCWAGRAQPHPGCALTGALCPGSQIRVEEVLLGNSGKPASSQLGNRGPEWAHALPRVTQQEHRCLSFPKPSLCPTVHSCSVMPNTLQLHGL